MPHHLSLDDVEDLSCDRLLMTGASQAAARSVARSIRAAERDAIRSHGLMYLPVYVEHLLCGKVLGQAVPTVLQPRASAIVVDAANGFAHPAIDHGWQALTDAARGTEYHVPFGGRGASSHGPREPGRYAAELSTTVKTACTAAGVPE